MKNFTDMVHLGSQISSDTFSREIREAVFK